MSLENETIQSQTEDTTNVEARDSGVTAEHIDSPPDRPVSEELPPTKYIEKRNEQEQGKKGGFQKRIDRITADKYQLRNQNEELRSRLDAIEARLPPAERTELDAERAGADPENSRPLEEQRQDGSENGQRATPDEQEQQRARQVESEFQGRLGKLVESRPELWEKANGINMHPALVELIKPALHELENGPELVTHLIENPAEVEKLHTMRPAAAIAYIGKISARLEAPKEKIRSKAEAPIQPVGGTARSTVPMEDLPPREYQRLMNEREAKRNGGYR